MYNSYELNEYNKHVLFSGTNLSEIENILGSK